MHIFFRKYLFLLINLMLCWLFKVFTKIHGLYTLHKMISGILIFINNILKSSYSVTNVKNMIFMIAIFTMIAIFLFFQRLLLY